MKVGFTGSRKGLSKEQNAKLLKWMAENVKDVTDFHHGDCIGADSEAHNALLFGRQFCKDHEVFIHIHPPLNQTLSARRNGDIVYPAKGYLERNQDIVNACDLLIAAPAGLEGDCLRSGTWATVRIARKLKKKILIL